MRRWARPSFLQQDRALPTDAARRRQYSGSMTEKYVFADVNLPFHVWVKEGSRWVLRDAGTELQRPAASFRAAPSAALGPDSPQPS